MPEVVQTSNIIINGARGAWMMKLDSSETNHLADGVGQYRFDSVSAPKFKIIRPESASAAEEFIEIALADGTVFRFDKTTTKVDAVTGATVSGTDTSVGGAEAGFTINSAPVLSYAPYPLDGTSTPTYMEWSDFVAELYSNLGADWLVVIPLGFSYSGWKDRHSTGKVLGYCIMCGKLNADVEIPMNGFAPVAIPLGFTARTISGGDASKLATAALPSIRCFEGKNASEYYTLAIPTSPDPLTSGTAADLLAGKALIIAA